jgi:hypothetical protein
MGFNPHFTDGCRQPASTCSRWFLARGFCTLKIEAIRSSETSVCTRSTWCHIPEDGTIHSSLFFIFFINKKYTFTCLYECVSISVMQLSVLKLTTLNYDLIDLFSRTYTVKDIKCKIKVTTVLRLIGITSK